MGERRHPRVAGWSSSQRHLELCDDALLLDRCDVWVEREGEDLISCRFRHRKGPGPVSKAAVGTGEVDRCRVMDARADASCLEDSQDTITFRDAYDVQMPH